MKHRQWIAFSGFVWLVMGSFLTFKGLKWMAVAVEEVHSLCFSCQEIFGGPQQTATVFIAVALLVGWVKGRFVFSKTVKRVVVGIASLKAPIRFYQLYSRGYWILIVCMIGLGAILRWLPIPVDVRGFIDIAVGSALIHGSLLYFRSARAFISVT